jgi:hypothetical protein
MAGIFKPKEGLAQAQISFDANAGLFALNCIAESMGQ